LCFLSVGNLDHDNDWFLESFLTSKLCFVLVCISDIDDLKSG
jgi:hypothetical protein